MALNWVLSPAERLSIDGGAVEYACWGPPPDQAPTLVLLHEGLGSVAQWKTFPARLAELTGFGVLAYSRLGYGRSDPAVLPRPLTYQTDEARGDVLGTVLDAAGIKRCVLLGHSDGATIAAIYGGTVSDMRVRGLILIAPHFFTEPSGLSAIAAAKVAYETGGMRDRLAKYHDDVDGAFFGWHDVWTDPDFKDWNVADCIDHWRIPVLAIQGTDDPYGTLAQISEIEERIYAPLETLILQDCGHAPHLERAEQTEQAVTMFCHRLARLEQAVVHDTAV